MTLIVIVSVTIVLVVAAPLPLVKIFASIKGKKRSTVVDLAPLVSSQ